MANSAEVAEFSIESPLERQIVIQNRKGLHARAAAQLVKLAESFDVDVQVCYENHTVGALSIMGLMMLGAAQGATICLTARGRDAKKAIDAIEDLIHNKFYEEF